MKGMSPMEYARIQVEQMTTHGNAYSNGSQPCDAFGIPLDRRRELDAREKLREAILPDFVRWLNEQGTRHVKEIPESLDLSARDESNRETGEPKHPATLRSVSRPGADQRQTLGLQDAHPVHITTGATYGACRPDRPCPACRAVGAKPVEPDA